MFGGQDTSFASRADAQLLATPVAVSVPGPVASFTLSPSSGLTPLVVSFTDTSTGTGLSWGWAFGDGTTYAGQNPPPKTYAASGIFTVTLTVSNAGGTNIAQHTVTVSDPAPAPPVASFNYSPPIGPAPLAVTFNDTSTGTPTIWAWDYGDGTVASVQNPPPHSFLVPGPYTVRLTVTNPGGSDTVTHVVQANVVCPTPLSSFTVSPMIGVKNVTQFDTTNNSLNMATVGCNNIWSWNFGDGTGISSSQSPANHIYTKRGTYTIELTASNLAGSSTSQRTVTVTN
jgi:PKD repeat protein